VALAPDIQVNGIAPGLLLTRWGQKFGPEQIKQLADKALLKQVTELEDCAALFVNLAKNGSLTGQNIVVDAGLTLT
jgi:NAD(P)-dependent dehydrogenase (short-subunit alcohol dehydrogenase family)